MTCSRCDTSFCYRCGENYRGFKLLGNHFSRLSPFGCRYNFMPDAPHLRRLIRGAVLGKLTTHSVSHTCIKYMGYNILPSTTAVFSYAIGSRKQSANKQFFVGAQTVVSLLQKTQIKQGLSFIAASKVYTSTNKTTVVWIETELFPLPGVDASHVYVCALALGCFQSY